MRYKSKFKRFFVFLIIGILIVDIFLGLSVLRNTANSKNEGITLRKSHSAKYGPSPVVSGLAIFHGDFGDENDYIEWSISTISGPGGTFYMMNNTEKVALEALPLSSRTRGNFEYTALLSDEEASASGTFYPAYSDTWWFTLVFHYTSFSDVEINFFNYKYDDFITVDEPTNSRYWKVNTSHYINWTSGGDFANVDIDLYHDSNFLRTIATNAQNNGSYFWRVPADISLFDDLYQVNISNTDFTDTWGISDSYFEITEKRSINVTKPSTSNSWATDTSEYINWTSTGSISNVMVELYNNDAFVMEITPNTPNDGEYFWAIPSGLDESDQYQIKISDESDPSVYNFSEYFRIFTFTITITNPDSESVWETDTSEFINWTSAGGITDVKIELFKNDVFELEINMSTPNDGDYNWTVPLVLGGSDQYQIKISDESDPSVYNFSEYFEIFSFTINITNPDSESVWETDTSEFINWTSTGGITDVKIELFKNDVFELEINMSTPNDGDYNWTVPSGLDGSDQYQIKISDESDPSVYDFSEYFEIFTFTVNITNPDSESVWEIDTSEYINWTSTGSISNVMIEVYNNDAFVMEITPNTPNAGEYFWAIPSGLDESDQYQIKVSDESDPSVYDFSEYFTVEDTINPVITLSTTNHTVEAGYIGALLWWTATDANPDTYTVELQGTGLVAGPTAWTSGDAINYSIPTGFGAGSYIYTVNFTDNFGNFATDSINFTVIDTNNPFITVYATDSNVEEGYSAQSLSWTVLDPTPNTYTIELLGTGIVVIPTLWTDNTPIIYNIPVGFSVGSYIYTINVTDDSGNFITDSVNFTVEDTTNPSIVSAPSDLNVEFGYTGQSLSWTATDLNPYNYTVDLQGSGIGVGPTSWTSGVAITYNIPDGFGVGFYTYTVNFTDDYGNSITDTVVFTVVDTTDPTIVNAPSDLTLDTGYMVESLSWTATDAHPDYYTIELQGSGVVAGSLPWTSGDPISYNIPDSLAAGVYVYTVTFTDEYNNFIQDSVTVTINSSSSPPPPGGIPFGNFFLIIIGLSVIGLIFTKKRQIARESRK